MCGGKYKDFTKHKALSVIKGEPLIERTTRILKDKGLDYYISSNEQEFEKYGKVLHHENSFEVENGVVKGYWVDAYYPTSEPTIYLHGDVYYTEEALDKIFLWMFWVFIIFAFLFDNLYIFITTQKRIRLGKRKATDFRWLLNALRACYLLSSVVS